MKDILVFLNKLFVNLLEKNILFFFANLDSNTKRVIKIAQNKEVIIHEESKHFMVCVSLGEPEASFRISKFDPLQWEPENCLLPNVWIAIFHP